LRHDLCTALKRKDKARIRRLVKDVRGARKAVQILWLFHRSYGWPPTSHSDGKTIEHRYGGLLARLDTLADRLGDYLAGRLDSIPELTAELHDPWSASAYEGVSVRHDRLKTPSCIK